MDKSKWPTLTLPEEEPMEGLTQEEVVTMNKNPINAMPKKDHVARVPNVMLNQVDVDEGAVTSEDMMDSMSNLS